MVKEPKSMVDGLAEETMVEMAESFFGARKQVEDYLERIQDMAGELKPKAAAAAAEIKALNGLLPDSGREEFYRALGVEPAPYLELGADSRADARAESPSGGLALTAAGRQAKQVLAAYGKAQPVVEDYLHGTYSPDPDHPGRMFLSSNLATLTSLAQAANERIASINQEPSHVLGYLRRLNVVEAEREKFTGGTLDDYADAADKALAYEPVDVAALDLPVLPDLPPLESVRGKLKPLLKQLFRSTS